MLPKKGVEASSLPSFDAYLGGRVLHKEAQANESWPFLVTLRQNETNTV